MQHRIQELDLLRGFSVIAMVIVITPGAWGVGYTWLNHADWSGLVPADLIFPCFLFCVGFAIPISLKKRIASNEAKPLIFQKILLRTTALIALGLLINYTQHFTLSNLRIPGILQRIGLCYFLVSVLLLSLTSKSIQHGPSALFLTAIITSLLVLYMGLNQLIPVPGYNAGLYTSDGSWASFIDLKILGSQHMWEWGQTNGAVTYDPEGLLATIPACINVLFGCIVAITSEKNPPKYSYKNLIILGVTLILLGYVFSTLSPIIKKIWTSSFALISAGISILLLAIFKGLKKYNALKILFQPLYVFGSNALLTFTMSFLALMWWLNVPLIPYQGETLNLRALGFHIILTYIPHAAFASLLFGCIFTACLYIPLSILYSKKWFIRL